MVVTFQVNELMVRATITDDARVTRTLGVFADMSLSRFDRSRATRVKLNAEQVRTSTSMNRVLAA
jgi:hypothetical protein